MRGLILSDEAGEVVYSYTRAQAIADGELVDLTEWASRSHGFLGGYEAPVAVTRAVWRDIEAIPASLEGWADVRGRAHDVLSMSRFSGVGRRMSDGTVKTRAFFVLTLPCKGTRKRNLTYKAIWGPGDDGKPCVTIMRPDED